MTYTLLKNLHMSCAAASYTLFVLRGIWMLRDSPILQHHWVKIAPHTIDTVLLASAVWLAYSIERYPFVDGWLTAKVMALLLYITLGSVALKYGKTKTIRLSAWIAAQLVFGYIVMVAVNHSPLVT